MMLTPTRMSEHRLVILVLLGLLIVGCAGTPQPSSQAPAATTQLTAGQQALALRLHTRMQEEHALGRDRAALRLGHELIDHYKGYSRLDHVVLTAARSSERIGEPDEALRLTAEFLSAWPQSPSRRDVYDLRAEIFEADQDWPRAAEALVSAHDSASLSIDREDASGRLDATVGFLVADELRTLHDAHPGSSLRPYLSYIWIRSLVQEERGRDALMAFSDLQGETPLDPWTAHAEQLLRDPTYEIVAAPPGQELPGDVDALQIGVLCPLTGRYTILGNAFYDGVRLARDQASRDGWRQYVLTVRDSEGDPVAAALAVRRFMQEERPIALIGGLLSAPTVAAALTAESYGVPLVSPTATNERIWELGPNTFQPNVTGLFEARLLARLVVHVMLKERVAILHPDDPDGLRSAQVFAAEVMALGGNVVGLEAFNTGLTDFREPLQRIEADLPEVIFVPASVDQMMILGPQLDFYRAGALVIGPSQWNSPRLAREVAKILERAVFPSASALFPPEWSTAFEANWSGTELPAEATAIAKKAYLAAMMVFHTMGESGASRSADLALGLADRFEIRREAKVNPEAMASSLRMFSGGNIVPFPMHLFTGSLALADSMAQADSLTWAADLESLNVTVPDDSNSPLD